MCPILFVHKHYIQIIQVAATPPQRGVEGGEQWVRFGEVFREVWMGGQQAEEGGLALDFVCPEHYCTRPSPVDTGSVSWPLRCLCSVLFLLSESSCSPGSLSLSRFLSRRLSWFSLSFLLLRFRRSLCLFFLRTPGRQGKDMIKISKGEQRMKHLHRLHISFRR